MKVKIFRTCFWGAALEASIQYWSLVWRPRAASWFQATMQTVVLRGKLYFTDWLKQGSEWALKLSVDWGLKLLKSENLRNLHRILIFLAVVVIVCFLWRKRINQFGQLSFLTSFHTWRIKCPYWRINSHTFGLRTELRTSNWEIG